MEYLPRAPLRTLPDRFRLYFHVWEYLHTSCVADHNYHMRFQKGWSHETDNRK